MKDTTPVLIGQGEFTFRGEAALAPSPLRLIEEASRRAAADAGLSAVSGFDGIGVVGFTADAPGALSRLSFPRLSNPPVALAAALGAHPRWSVYTNMGGNSPQQLVNIACERIAAGENDLILLTGAEFLGSLMRRLRAGDAFADYETGPSGTSAPERVGDPRPGVSEHEAAHGLSLPVNTYPLFENALRARDRRGLTEHQRRLGKLFAPFTRIAVANPFAWFPIVRSAEELIEVGPENRMIGFPYPKYLNAIMQVDQSAALVLASLEKARELLIAEDRCVFLHGCADAADLWSPLDRQNYHSSPAMRATGEHALGMAGIEASDLAFIDLYSCFPSAVQIGAEEFGLALDDPRGLTVTGGLPYFGGPGNNYAMHSIATTMRRLRERPGSFGVCTANGWYLTKQSVGVYSTAKPKTRFSRQDPSVIQRRVDALAHPDVIEQPEG
ncbi:MAG: acetyl-CoA acetyltransferase, partial [Caulobacteraceae bacterium]